MIGGLKECGTFAGEKKGTFFLVIRNSVSAVDLYLTQRIQPIC